MLRVLGDRAADAGLSNVEPRMRARGLPQL
jgi:hypothetical protein